MKVLFYCAIIDVIIALIFVIKIWLEYRIDKDNPYRGPKPDIFNYAHVFFFWPIYLIIDIFRLCISLKQKLTRKKSDPPP